jgi:hypothetical protein
MDIVCPYCRARYRVPETAAGTHVKCINQACLQAFVVSEVPGLGVSGVETVEPAQRHPNVLPPPVRRIASPAETNAAHLPETNTRRKLTTPAIVFIVVNSISLTMALFCVILVVLMPTGQFGITDRDLLLQKSLFLLFSLAYVTSCAVSVVGGAFMLARRYRRFCMAAAIVSIIPGVLAGIMIILHIPVAIWVFCILRQPDTTRTFQAQ